MCGRLSIIYQWEYHEVLESIKQSEQGNRMGPAATGERYPTDTVPIMTAITAKDGVLRTQAAGWR